MDKPTIFFSHSSKDKELILPIKNKLDNITSNVMDIFMSSDGQSIPFGHNWVHKIEEGLKKAQIMFVFVTPTSINSSWIYFEAGFAYSKGIEVIPVGLGVNIGQLKPPLNLLQGFDIISYESLNNFVSVINKKFNFKFEENFIDDDYKKINSILNKIPNCINIGDIFYSIEYELYSQYHDENGNIIRYNIDEFFNNIINYLEEKNISYSSYVSTSHCKNTINKSILVNGIYITIYGIEQEPDRGFPNQEHILTFSLSMQNFIESFNLLLEILLKLQICEKWLHLDFNFYNSYDCLKDKASISSIISQNKQFNYLKNNLNAYEYKNKSKFWFHNKEHGANKKPHYILTTCSDINDTSANNIIELITELQNVNLIYKI